MPHPWRFGVVTTLVSALLCAAIGAAIGSYWVSMTDCPDPKGCEGSMYVAPAFGFFGFWIGLVLGICASVAYVSWMRNKPSAESHDESTAPN